MLTNPIRFAKGDIFTPVTHRNLADSMADSWTLESWTALTNAITDGRSILTQTDGWGLPHVNWSVTTMAEVKVKAQAVEAGIVNLRWADDPTGATEYDAEVLNTMPDPFKFKTDLYKPKGSYVQNAADWELRAREIRYLASVLEYGPIPDPPSSHTVTVTSTPPIPVHWELPPWYIVGGLPSKVAATPGTYSFTPSFTYTGAESATFDGTADTRIAGFNAMPGTRSTNYTISYPSPSQKATAGLAPNEPVAVMLSYGGSTGPYLTRGVAVLTVPSGLTSDTRSTNGLWDTRSGTFRNFYPYTGRGQRYEISNEMAAAWGASRAIDALEDAVNQTLKSRSVVISNITSGNDFKLGDKLSDSTAGNATWWTVGEIDGPDTPEGQSGTGAIKMLYLAADGIPPTTGGTITFTQFQSPVGMNGNYQPTTRSGASAVVVVGEEVDTGTLVKDWIDPAKIGITGFSVNGKHAFCAALFDPRIKVVIPGAAGASGPEVWRYVPKGNEYAWESANTANDTSLTNSGEVIGDHITHNPGRSNEVFRRFLNYFAYYEIGRGIDANGDFSRGYATRLPYDGHELVASLFPRAIIENNTRDDYSDGSEPDAVSLQGARVVYRALIAMGVPAQTLNGTNASADELVMFNYRMSGGHSEEPAQREREAYYMGWYFFGLPIASAYKNHLDYDPFYHDVLVPGGSNSYDRHYGGLKTMMPWPWAGPYYPTKQY
jgi:hypothetical protein